MRHISDITKKEFIELVKIVLHSDFKLNSQDWKVLDYGEEPGTAIRYDAEDYELRIAWEEPSPVSIFIVAQGHFEGLEIQQRDSIRQKLQEMGFNISVLKTWDFADTELIFEEDLTLLKILE